MDSLLRDGEVHCATTRMQVGQHKEPHHQSCTNNLTMMLDAGAHTSLCSLRATLHAVVRDFVRRTSSCSASCPERRPVGMPGMLRGCRLSTANLVFLGERLVCADKLHDRGCGVG